MQLRIIGRGDAMFQYNNLHFIKAPSLRISKINIRVILNVMFKIKVSADTKKSIHYLQLTEKKGATSKTTDSCMNSRARYPG